MKVGELINILQAYDSDLNVLIPEQGNPIGYGFYYSIVQVLLEPTGEYATGPIEGMQSFEDCSDDPFSGTPAVILCDRYKPLPPSLKATEKATEKATD